MLEAVIKNGWQSSVDIFGSIAMTMKEVQLDGPTPTKQVEQ